MGRSLKTSSLDLQVTMLDLRCEQGRRAEAEMLFMWYVESGWKASKSAEETSESSPLINGGGGEKRTRGICGHAKCTWNAPAPPRPNTRWQACSGWLSPPSYFFSQHISLPASVNWERESKRKRRRETVREKYRDRGTVLVRGSPQLCKWL